ncbi:MAG: DNA-binding protein [Methanobacteriota archaeon]|nr:MAG: DNA-binding protein [Euryarchaeota archaeon]
METKCRYEAIKDGFLLRIYPEYPVMATLQEFLEKEKIGAGSLTAIGALKEVELGYFYLNEKTYSRKKFEGIYELVSFIGNISIVEGKPFVHAHAVLSGPDYHPIAGHFFDGIVAVTMEVHLQPSSESITREDDTTTGLKLLKLSRLL